MKIYTPFTDALKKRNYSALLTAAAIVAVFVMLFAFGSRIQSVRSVSRSFYALGTVIQAELRTSDTKEAERVFSLINAKVTEIHRMCDVNGGGELAKLNAALRDTADSDIEVSGELYALLKLSAEYAEITDGAFDYTLGKLTDLWGMNDFEAGQPDGWKPPAEHDIAAVLPLCGYTNVTLAERGGKYYVSSRVAGLKINLGGVAKGYAERECAVILQSEGALGLLNFGGNLAYVYPSTETFTLSVEAPDPGENGGTRYTLFSCAVNGGTAAATSGAYNRFFESGGVKYGHIFDSKTGSPADSVFAGVTILCGDPAIADIMSTAAYVSGEYFGYDHIGIRKSGVIDSSVPYTASAAAVAAKTKVEVYVSGELVRTAPLGTDTVFTVQVDGGGYNTVSISGGKVAVTDADCPDKLCVNVGYSDSLPIVCLPHRLEVVIT
ncbi:hypothetical protein FACS1894133_2110 [Clostridia bacterium]|nr:hypothetical protein FACS1894133_2110 [Clostridia bacterium]